MCEDNCIVCGNSVPEGRMVCYKCEYPEEPSFDTIKTTVLLNGVKDVAKFSALCSKCNCVVVVKSGYYSVNAKSIMGLLSLDLSKPLKLEFYGNVPREVREGIKKFIID